MLREQVADAMDIRVALRRRRRKYIKQHADFSVDPCDDFFAHVCPASTKGRFFVELAALKAKIVGEFRHSDQRRDAADFEQKLETLRRIIKSRSFKNLCQVSEKVMSNFSRQFVTIYPGDQEGLDTFNNMSCEDKLKMVTDLEDPAVLYEATRRELSLALNAHIANQQAHVLDHKVRIFYNKLKNAVRSAIKRTPWAKNNRAVSKYLHALNKIIFTTFADARNTSTTAFQIHSSITEKCLKQLGEEVDEERRNIICDVIASGAAKRALHRPIDKIYAQDWDEILADRISVFNSKDDRVYMGNDIMLLMNTDYLSDLYGSVGFMLTHEIMHTFVFDDLDIASNKSLVPFWTKDYKCVEEQNLKTCETFPTATCDARRTFEEDAADMAAYRIVWDLYRKAYQRKTRVENYEALDKKQLFFYGAAVVFCEENGLKNKVNSVMSQMDEFAEAFTCKPTDKMVVNKARHCELYGSKASATSEKNGG
ncbi:unnamed protein product [Caenorhabditis sp. 36 PRJEB53466]|nr:unnamed protein product [Caenorhabditis sp. 36 PRJEB53466]